MTIKYINEDGELVSDSSVTSIQPIQNGVNVLIESSVNYVIAYRNVVEVVNV